MPINESERYRLAVTFRDAAKGNELVHWEEIGSDQLVLEDALQERAYGSTERKLRAVSSKLKAIESSTSWRFVNACGQAASKIPLARLLARRLFH